MVLDSVRRVPAQLVVSDGDADLALLRINRSACPNCPRLRRAPADSTGAVVQPGERVLAIGFALPQQSIVTSGVVSIVRGRAIISDANIKRGSSGGPLLNMAGEVVGVSTFTEQGNQDAGTAGSIAATQLAPLIARAADTLRSLPEPENRLLPTIPGPPYPLAALRYAASVVPVKTYEKLEGFEAGNFLISFSTPVSSFAYPNAFENEVTRDRRRRETRADLPQAQRYSDAGGERDWAEYVGDVTSPAVTLEVDPRVGETVGSALTRGMLAAGGYLGAKATYVFKGDVEGVSWIRNYSEIVTPIRGGRAPQLVYVNSEWIVMKDVAYRGLYVLPPDVFAPNADGVPPSIVGRVRDLEHPSDSNFFELPAEVVARIWNDFSGYYQAVRPTVTFVRADPLRFKSRLEAFCRSKHMDYDSWSRCM